MITKNAIAHLILQHTPKLDRLQRRKYLEEFGSAENLVEYGLNKNKERLVNQFDISSDWKKELEICEKEEISLVAIGDPLYPTLFSKLKAPPNLLRMQGKAEALQKPIVSMVGTRNATLYGKEIAFEIASQLAYSGVVVASGLARGIDTASHKGALSRGETIAIIGSGLKRLYPRENEKLAESIANQGVVMSEYPLFTPPARFTFPQRNRLIAAACKGIVLIESPEKGGSMITMEYAEKENKELFTIPARLEMETFKGNFALLKEQRALLIESAADILNRLQIFSKKNKDKINIELNSEEQRLHLPLSDGEKSINELVLLTQLPMMQLNVLLTRLILKGLVKEFPGKVYKWVNH